MDISILSAITPTSNFPAPGDAGNLLGSLDFMSIEWTKALF